MTARAQRCVAPSCGRPALYVATGVDDQGEHFTDHVCGGCGSWLRENGAVLALLASARAQEPSPHPEQ